jgi:hypothetical protein
MSRFNLGPVLNALPKTPIRVFRGLAGARVDGFWMDPGQTEPVTGITANVQDDELGRRADEVLHDSKRWKVMLEADWSGHGYRKFIAGRTPNC